MPIRSFIAVSIDEILRQEIIDLQQKLKSDIKKIKWINPSNMHITLIFLGEISESNLPDIFSIISHSIHGISPFTLSFKGVGIFPNAKKPRVIWTGVEKGKKEIEFLYKKLNQSLKSLEYLNYKQTNRTFTAHLTLGRVKNYITENIAETINNYSSFSSTEMAVKKIIFFKSILYREGPKYISLKEFSLSQGLQESIS